MTSGEARSPPSDTDERPVRKQLKETSIDSSNNTDPSEDPGPATSGPEQGSGRKRSFEEARGDTDDAVENGDGPRKRSRECTPEDLKKEKSTTVPALDNVSEPIPKDPVPATPKNLATDESSHEICDGYEAEFIVISDPESEDPVLLVKPAILGAPQEIIEISSDSECGSEIGIVEVPEVLEVISISDSESESEEVARATALARTREQSFDSVELKWLNYFGYTRESTPESEISGAPFARLTRSPTAMSSSGRSSDQEYHSCDENDNTNTTSQDTKNHTAAGAMNDDNKTMKNKRSLEQLEEEGAKKPEETEKKRHRDSSQERETQTANVSLINGPPSATLFSTPLICYLPSRTHHFRSRLSLKAHSQAPLPPPHSLHLAVRLRLPPRSPHRPPPLPLRL